MKRSFSLIQSGGAVDGAGSTPRPGLAVPKAPATSGQRTKRARQTSLRAFLCVDTPLDTPAHALQPALNSGGSSAAAKLEWPSTAQRALENLRVGTPALPSIGPQVAPQRRQPGSVGTAGRRGRTSGSPAIFAARGTVAAASPRPPFQADPCPPRQQPAIDLTHEDDADEDDFRIQSSQTYHRCTTQPEDTNASWQDTWLPSDILMPSLPGPEPRDLAPPAPLVAPLAVEPALTLGDAEGPEHRVHQLEQPGTARAQPAAVQEEDDHPFALTQEGDAPRDGHTQHSQKLTPPQLPNGAEGSGHPHARQSAPGTDMSLGGTQPLSTGPRSAQAVTPELVPVQMQDGGGDPASCPPSAKDGKRGVGAKPVAAMFRKKDQRKVLVLVRHGESEYNRAVKESKSVKDPDIFDPHLTAKGVAQCVKLQQELNAILEAHMAKCGDPVWVVSPLTRAIQTFLLSCPFQERLPKLVPPPMPSPLSSAFGFQQPQFAGSGEPRRSGSSGSGSGLSGPSTLTRMGSGGLAVGGSSGLSRFSQGATQPAQASRRGSAGSVTDVSVGAGLGLGGPYAGPSSCLPDGFGGAGGTGLLSMAPGGGASGGAAGRLGSGSSSRSTSFSFMAPGEEGPSRSGSSSNPPLAAVGPTPALAALPTAAPVPPAGPPPQPMKIHMLPAISEFMTTPGDVGRPPAHLVREFPQLATELSTLPHTWWHHTANTTCCALTKRWEGVEPSERRVQRVREFVRWLDNRPEQLFVLVGHSCFWHKFLNKSGNPTMRNCEVITMTW